MATFILLWAPGEQVDGCCVLLELSNKLRPLLFRAEVVDVEVVLLARVRLGGAGLYVCHVDT